ncbi:MAG: hypothetical protein COB26_09380 [Piscirickettsiaceae bacterium]|nr:MAG: hypothetical protein COB89_03535 [Piscirickettsiaceae bacterium]PCI67797.1 MAG: hypothetical protein COB26_09380 [Piscirickettsiaceae bacterium]
MKFIYLLLFIVFLTLGFVLSVSNSAPIKINYYYGWLEMPLSFALLATLVIGVILGISVGVLKNLKLRRKLSKLSKQASITKQEVTNLRTFPINPSN